MMRTNEKNLDIVNSVAFYYPRRQVQISRFRRAQALSVVRIVE